MKRKRKGDIVSKKRLAVHLHHHLSKNELLPAEAAVTSKQLRSEEANRWGVFAPWPFLAVLLCPLWFARKEHRRDLWNFLASLFQPHRIFHIYPASSHSDSKYPLHSWRPKSPREVRRILQITLQCFGTCSVLHNFQILDDRSWSVDNLQRWLRCKEFLRLWTPAWLEIILFVYQCTLCSLLGCLGIILAHIKVGQVPQTRLAGSWQQTDEMEIKKSASFIRHLKYPHERKRNGNSPRSISNN